MTIFHRDTRDRPRFLGHEANLVTVAHRCVATRDLEIDLLSTNE
jgi:hypothetical protein